MFSRTRTEPNSSNEGSFPSLISSKHYMRPTPVDGARAENAPPKCRFCHEANEYNYVAWRRQKNRQTRPRSSAGSRPPLPKFSGYVDRGGGTLHISSKHYMGPTPFYGARAENTAQKTDFAMKQTNICRLSGDIISCRCRQTRKYILTTTGSIVYRDSRSKQQSHTDTHTRITDVLYSIVVQLFCCRTAQYYLRINLIIMIIIIWKCHTKR